MESMHHKMSPGGSICCCGGLDAPSRQESMGFWHAVLRGLSKMEIFRAWILDTCSSYLFKALPNP